MRFDIVQGDLEPDLDLELLDAEGEPEDLADATAAALRVELPNGTRQLWTLVPIDKPNGRYRHQWSVGETELVGQYKAQAAITRGNGQVQTFPSDDRYIRWRVHPRLT